jgi:hypothetical protein
MDRIIVSRHQASIEFIAHQLGGQRVYVGPDGGRHTNRLRAEADYGHEFAEFVCVRRREWDGTIGCAQCGVNHPDCHTNNERIVLDDIPVTTGNVTAEDVRGKTVYGVLPLHLAAAAASVWAIEFSGAPPRGQEYTLPEMVASGARLRPYVVISGETGHFGTCPLCSGHGVC